jgi:blue copper oxidase
MRGDQASTYNQGVGAAQRAIRSRGAAFHGGQFRIISRDGKPPEPERAGWKDVAPISNGGVCEILLRFPYSASRDDPYMAHCHILEHEDSGMMAQFTVS